MTTPTDPPTYPDSVETPSRPTAVHVRRPATQPVVSYAILGVTVFVFVLQLLVTSGQLRGPFEAVAHAIFSPDEYATLEQIGLTEDLMILLGGKITPLILLGQVWRLLTPVLLHASLMHIGFNMYSLYAIGPALESYYGHKRFLLLYLLAAFGGNVLSFVLSTGISVGASTAIFGLVAAEGVFIYQNRALFGPQARTMLTNVVVIVVINLFMGLNPRIDNWGHFGGMIAGLIFAWFAGPLLALRGEWPEFEAYDRRPALHAWLFGGFVFILFALIAALGAYRYLA